LVVLCEMNVLNLISQRLDTIYQIKTKRATVLFLHLFAEQKHPSLLAYLTHIAIAQYSYFIADIV
jgi:hypothetical protein